MGALTSRQNATVEEADVGSNHAYKYPPRSGSYFGSHFIMGGERFDTPQPEAYLFGENADLNFLGNRPTAFPYPPPQANEPTKTLKSLVNIRKESVRFVKAPDSATKIHGDGASNKGNSFNIEFVFDSDAKCAITIFYFCTEETSPSGITYIPKESLTSETYHYKKGVNQHFSQPSHIFNPNLFSEDDLTYNAEKDIYPVAIHCVVEEECRQSHTTICVIDHHTDGTYVLRALKQKIFVDGLCYLLQEIYGIENKTINKPAIDDDTDDNGSECVICMSDTRDTLILPCRHLCLCNSCADSLRYQANNCPICRAPFRALLQIKAVQKGVSSNILAPQNSPDPNCENVPAGYIPVSLIEALNGPPQCIVRTLSSESGDGDVNATRAVELLNKSVDKSSKSPKSGTHKRSKSIKVNNENNSTEIRMSVLKSENATSETDSNSKITTTSNNTENPQKLPSRQLSRESLKIVNERHSLKLQPSTEQDDDSDSEKLSPLLQSNKNNSLRSALHIDGVDESIDADTDTDVDDLKSDNSKKRNQPALLADGDGNILAGAEDSDYYTPEDPQTTILSPLCPENPTIISEKIPHKGNNNAIATTSQTTKNLSPINALKDSHNSLPDSPISTGNPSSARSSNDSYSSSSSTKQLLTPNITNVSEAKGSDDKSFSGSNTINV